MLDNLTVEKIIREYLNQNYHMSLATCVNNKPWVCEVHFAVDAELNIYWRSKTDRRHSQEVVANPYVAGNVVAQHGLTDEPRGVYFEGIAEQLHTVDENDAAYKALAKRQNLGMEILEDAHSINGHQFYKITVSNWYLFDAKESKPSNKYQLVWNENSNSRI